MSNEDRFRTSVIELLGVSAVARDELVQALVKGGTAGNQAAVTEQLRQLLQFDTSFTEVADGVACIPSVAEGTVWAVWVDRDDAAAGFVRSDPQLSALSWWLIGADVALVDASGSVIGNVETDAFMIDDRDTDVILGPEGWLDGLAGGWASVAVTGAALCWTPAAAAPDPDARQVAAVAEGFTRAIVEPAEVPEGMVSAVAGLAFATSDDVMHEALLVDRDAFTAVPIAGVPELFAAAGLEHRSGLVAEVGADWGALRDMQERAQTSMMYDLAPNQIDGLTLAVGACLSYVDEGLEGLGATEDERDSAAILIAAVVEDGDVASAFWDEGMRRRIPLDGIGRFDDELAGRLVGNGQIPAGLGWVRARCLDWAGDTAGAEALLMSLADSENMHWPLLVEAAGFASDRGDARTAYRLLRQAGIDASQHVHEDGDEHDHDDPEDMLGAAELLLVEVERFALSRPKPMAERNDKCPCGSGKKYKACHLGSETFSLDDRSAWLYDKIVRFVRARHYPDMSELADVLSTGDAGLFEELLEFPLVADMVMHEGRVSAEFLEARGAILPADELALAGEWQAAERGVFEVLRVGSDWLQLQDLRIGGEITIVSATPNALMQPGSLLVGRPLPVGGGYRAFSGFVPITPDRLGPITVALSGGDVDELAMQLAGIFAPVER
jgi:hypothetical protein